MPGLSFPTIVARVELLNSALKPQLEKLPHLQDESADLDQLLTEVKSLNLEQAAVKGRLSELSRLRREAERRSNDLHSRIAAQLKGKLGFANENLMAFGIPPRRKARKKAQPQAAATPATPPEAPSPEPEGTKLSQ